jgi:hypothetical protein
LTSRHLTYNKKAVVVEAGSCGRGKAKEVDIMALTASCVVLAITVAATVAAPPGGKLGVLKAGKFSL